jgi:hypothetical protein
VVSCRTSGAISVDQRDERKGSDAVKHWGAGAAITMAGSQHGSTSPAFTMDEHGGTCTALTMVEHGRTRSTLTLVVTRESA